ncbi:MAG: putative C-S lyase [Flexilinea flocculi]|jgi:cystathionine beta-lyase|nr:putative C-S lyase [Flexilinea flocculi]
MQYDFDKIIDRQGTNALKWEIYPKDVLPLWVADMDFAVAPPIIEQIKKRLEHPIFGYSINKTELIEIIQKRMKEKYQWNIERDSIILVPGIVSGFNFACRSMCNPGDSVIFQTPVYPPFFQAPVNNHLNHFENPLWYNKKEKTYQIDFDDFEKKIDKTTKLFILCNPHNPVGRVFTPEELTRLGEICSQKGVSICSDEIHSDLIFRNYQHTPIASLNPDFSNRTITFIAPSKTYNIPGLACSAAIIPNTEIREKFQKSIRGFCNEVTFIAQEAGYAAYAECDDWLKQLNLYLESNRDFLVNFISREIPEIELNHIQGTYLAWLDCSKLGIEGSPQKFFEREAKVGLNDGAAFGKGYEDYVRLNFGTPRSILSEALERMADAIRKNR